MTEPEEKKVSGEGQDTGVPTPKFSDQPASSTSSLSPEAIAELSKQLLPQLDEAIERKIQGTKDKRFAKLNKGEQTLTEILATLKGKGVDIPKDVEQEYAIKDYINSQIQESKASEPVDNGMSTVKTSAEGQFDALSVMKSLNLDTNDAEVINLLKGTYRNPDHFRADATSLALRKVAKPAATGAETPPLGGGDSHKVDNDALVKELATLQKTPTKNPARMKEIQKLLGW